MSGPGAGNRSILQIKVQESFLYLFFFRISTGNELWDSHLFAADNFDKAKLYGDDVVGIGARDDAKILYEGTKEWRDVTKSSGSRKGESLLDYADRTSRAAQDAGYDAAWYKRDVTIARAKVKQFWNGDGKASEEVNVATEETTEIPSADLPQEEEYKDNLSA